MHAVRGGAGQAAGCLWTRGARCLPGPARSASPLWLQQRPQSAPRLRPSGPPSLRSRWDPRPACTSAPSPGTWKVSLPAVSGQTPARSRPLGPKQRGLAGLGEDGKGSTGGVSAQLPAWTLGRRGRAASCPNPVPPSPGDPAAETRAAEPRAEEGVGGRRGTGERDQRESESLERWGDSRGAPESRGTRRRERAGGDSGRKRAGEKEEENRTPERGKTERR